MDSIKIPGDVARRLVTAQDPLGNHTPVKGYIVVRDEHITADPPDVWRLIIRDQETGDHYAALHKQNHTEWLKHGHANYPWPDVAEVEFYPVKQVTRTVEVVEYEDA